MSKIKAELIATSGLKPNRGEAEEAFLMRVVNAIGTAITDAQWDATSSDAQDWNNEAADAITAKKPLPPFPDAEAAAPAPAPATRRRGAAPAAPVEPVAYEPKEGDEVTVTTKRKKIVTGFIVSLTDESVFINKDADGPEADDEEFKLDGLVIVKASADVPEAGVSADEPAGPVEPEVTDTVEVKTARGKVFVGNITEITDDELVLTKADGEVEELLRKNIASIVVKVKNAGSAPAAPAPTGRRGRGAAPVAASADDVKKSRSVNAPGVSLGGRIREIVCANPVVTIEKVSAQLTKEGIQFADASVKIIVKEVTKVIDELRTLGKLK